MFKRIGQHVIPVLVILGLVVVWPIAAHFDVFGGSSTDAVSQASMKLPDQPSGEFLVLINTKRHADTLEDWETFFKGEEEDLPVIFDDIDCLAASSDVTAMQLADRYLAQLPENQMKLRTEDATMLASKAEAGLIDVAFFSEEMADALSLAGEKDMKDVRVIRVKGADE